MIQIDMYQAKPVEAVKVTAENKETLAVWCGGRIEKVKKASGESVSVLYVPIGTTIAPREGVARSASWIVKEPSGRFRIFYSNAFERIFDKINVDSAPDDQEAIIQMASPSEIKVAGETPSNES